MENQKSYRIRTNVGDNEPINIPISLMQEYNSFEILSLKINTDDTYRSYTSNEGIIVGRVSTANNGLGIPNVRVSVFVPKGAYEQSDEEAVLYPFSSPTDLDGDRVRYNLLPSESDVQCYQVIGTLPTKRKILDNETVCEVFDKYYKYTTVTNEAGDFMLTNIPVGKQRLHIDADLSDIGPFLSQKPYNMIENLGIDKNKFESVTQFKTSKDLDSLAQVISQNKSVYVYPYWGDATENSAEMKITRTDLSLNYEFKTHAVFMGSVITDKQSNSIRQNCTATDNAGKMSEMITGPGRIEMIRKTIDNKIEQYKVKGDLLINDNGVWCYAIPMNLDYVRTDEFGNIIPTDDPNKGVPTRARVRFRITLNQMQSDEDAHKRCSYLVPNNPKIDDEMFRKTNDADYSFGSDTWDESFVDLFWNKVYTVKNFVPRFQKSSRPTNRRHTGVKMVNHFGDNNPFPYNNMSIKLPFIYRLICVLVKILIYIVGFINGILSVIGYLPCWLAFEFELCIFVCFYPLRFVKKFIPGCISISPEFCDDGINRVVTYPGCIGCIFDHVTVPKCTEEQRKLSENGEEQGVCTNSTGMLFNCVENQLAQQNEATSFNFHNDWINGCLYMPLWYRHIRPKKSFFFGLFTRRAKDEWCAGEKNTDGLSLKYLTFCANGHTTEIEGKDFEGKSITYHIMGGGDSCGDNCHRTGKWFTMTNGVIINRQTMLGQKVWYYKAVEVTSGLNGSMAAEYLDYIGLPQTSKYLYATDIVLLGSLNDCDTNGIPKFFNYLRGSTYNMPTDVLFTDTDITYKFDLQQNLLPQEVHQTSVASGCDWGNDNEYGYDDGGLFYSIGCSSIDVDNASCVNLKRICELGVGLDEMQYINNLNDQINSETDELDNANNDYYLRPDGFVSFDDIIDFDYRSMFATMNGNGLKTKINSENGLREYDFRHLYIDNFDGSLLATMMAEQIGRGKANYKNNWKLESANADYLLFRFGDKPFFYDGNSLVYFQPSNTDIAPNKGPGGYSFPKYKNSFYFYFGLKEGKTAIDLFNQLYNEPCSSKNEENEAIPYECKGNSWCCKDSDEKESYNHITFDGFLKLNMENVIAPYSIIINSRSNKGVTYTVVKSNDKDTKLSYERICLYGEEGFKDDIKRVFGGYSKCSLIYEYGDTTIGECYMMNNGEYEVIITDGEGNYHTFIVNIKSDYLQFDDKEEKFKQPNDVLTMTYGNYMEIAKKGSINTTAADGIPYVERKDGENVINGTIALYNIFYRSNFLDSFIIEVKPYDEKENEDIKDYNFIINNEGYECTFGKEIKDKVNVSSTKSPYFVYQIVQGDSGSVPSYILKCPKGDVDYSVRITQLCGDEESGYYKTNNYVEKKIRVEQPQPYKLYINDVDYDIIKKFNSGWSLSDGSKMQTRDGYGPEPFKGIGDVKKINGWNDMGNIGEGTPYDWGVDKKQYGTNADNELFDKDEDGEYKIINEYNDWLSKEPIVTNPTDEEQITKHVKWEEEVEWAKEKIEILNNRLKFLEKMKDSFWLFCRGETKTISYQVLTDNNPYDLWSMYNPDIISGDNEDYVAESRDDDKKQGWRFIGNNESVIDEVAIPTLTHHESEAYGDGVIVKDNEPTYCFAQDNIAEGIESVNYKPPFLIACVNSAGISKPFGLSKGIFFAETTNEYGLKKNSFGNVNGNSQNVSVSDNVGFFSFHIIDKIFDYGLTCWSYIDKLPKFLPYEKYTELDDKRKKKGEQEKLVIEVECDGIASIELRNGKTMSSGYVDDFDTQRVINRDVAIKTFNNNSEFDIPTKRCVLVAKNTNETKEWDEESKEYRIELDNGWYLCQNADENDELINVSGKIVVDSYVLPYQKYRHINEDKVTEIGQYALIPNTTGKFTMADLGSKCEISDTLYGAMNIILLNGQSKNSENNILNVMCVNGDTISPITYYLYKVSKTNDKETKTSEIPPQTDTWVYYPINAFEDGMIECNGIVGKWSGGKNDAAYFINRNTITDVLESLATKNNEDGNFDIEDNSAYCVIAVTQNNCRTISPVYDFTPINYVFGLVDYGFKKTLRFAFVDVLNGDLTANNYYLTQYDFNGGYNFVGTEGGITKTPTVGTFNYKYGTEKKFIDFEDFYNNAKIGESYIEGETSPYKVWTRELGRIYDSDQDEFAANKEIDKAYEVEHGEGSWKQLTSTQKDTVILKSDLAKKFRVDLNKEYTSEIPTDKAKYQVIKFDTEGENLIYDYSTYSDSRKTDEMKDTCYFASWTYTPPMSVPITVIKYFRYSSQEVSSYISTKNPFDTPYFADYCEVNIDDTTYEYLKNTLDLSEKDKYLSVTVRDKVGIMHQCKLSDIIPTGSTLTETNEKWYDIIFRNW